MLLFRFLRWNKILRFLLLLVLLFAVMNIISFIIYWVKWPDLEDILETKKCPMCFGTELCPLFHNRTIKLSDKFKHIFFSYINVKNVYEATFMDKRAVLKKLGHNWEWKEFDQNACDMFDSNCHSSDRRNMLDYKELFLRDIMNSVTFEENQSIVKNFIVCPNVESVNMFLEPFIVYDKNISFAHVWTMFNLNAEPILLKYLNIDNNPWPVPKYYGVCGRAVVMEFAGTPLSSFHFNDSYHRIDISLKLLEIAFNITFQHPQFRFYLTDVSCDNIVINDNGFPIVIDLENVIVLTKTTSVKVTDVWMKNHSSEVIPCDGCFSFSTDEICSHRLSDHNIYSFCTLIKDDILTNNFKMPHIKEALLECISPRRLSDRFHAANILIEELKNALNSNSSETRKSIRELKYSKDYT